MRGLETCSKNYEHYRSNHRDSRLLFLFNLTQSEKNKLYSLFQEYSKGKIKKYFIPLDYLTAEIGKGNKRNIQDYLQSDNLFLNDSTVRLGKTIFKSFLAASFIYVETNF